MRTIYMAFVSFVFFSVPCLAEHLPLTIQKVKPSVVAIGVHTPLSRPQNVLRGSGFVVGDGSYIVTNSHVLPKILDDALNQKMAVFVGIGKNSKVVDAEVIAQSKTYDLAILKIKGKKLPAIKLAKNDYLLEGSEIAFTGFPIGAVLGLYPVTHKGIISALTPVVIPVDNSSQISLNVLKRLRDPYMVYQLDAVAYPGNSGSAMYDIKTGEVVGILNKVFVQATKESVITKPSGISYAIPVKYLRQLLRENNIKL